MIIRDFPVANHNVVRQHAANGFMESTADAFVGHFEIRPGFRVALAHAIERLLNEIKCRRRCISLKISARPVALKRIAPLRDLPFEFGFGEQRRFSAG